MNTRSYTIIFALLSCCILFILALQGFWIRSFYLQKKEEMDRSVYSALEELTTKLQDRKNLQSLKMTYFIQDGDTIAKTPSRKMTLISASSVQIINKNKSHVSTAVKVYGSNKFVKIERDTIIPDVNDKQFNLNEKKAKVKVNPSTKAAKEKDSIVIGGNSKRVDLNLGGRTATVIPKDNNKSLEDVIKESANNVPDPRELKKLVDKMLTEIRIIDDQDEESPDSLQALIKRALVNKGIFLPFEFSMQNLKLKKKIIAQSNNFSDQLKTFKRDLSTNKIIYTGDFLFLQFPGQDDFVLAGMRSSLILSLVFSLVIMSVFYYVIRIILAQKKLSEIKNDFVNNMTHELKTPIATISLALDAIANPLIKNDEEKFKEYTRILKEENKKLDTHVERVLQISLLGKGKLQLDKKSVKVKDLLHLVIKTYQLQIAEQKAEVEVDVPENLNVFADEGHIKTVFANLLDNALKYSKENCKIGILASQEKNHITIRFKDNGIGIDADQQKKVFEKFYRVQGGNLHDVKGFGLGLSYVKSIVEAHGGSLEVRSELGKGSEFVLVLSS